MTTNPTPCDSCVFFREVWSPMPGESWNRCSHPQRRLEGTSSTPSVIYGYANKRCSLYKEGYSFVLGGLLKRLVGYVLRRRLS